MQGPRPGLQFRTNETVRSIGQRLIELGPNLAATHCAQSSLSFLDLNFPKAKALAQKAVELGPDYEFGRMCYGFMLIHWGLAEEGRREIDAARHLQPSKAMTYRCYGHMYYLKREFTNACAMYRQIIEWEPNHVVAFRFLARACQALGDYSNSIPYLEKASVMSGKQDVERLRNALEREGVVCYAISSPSGSWPGVRNVLTNSPSPQTVIPGNRLNHRPVGTSGWVSSQTASNPSWLAGMWRCWITVEQMLEQGRWKVLAADLRHEASRRKSRA